MSKAAIIQSSYIPWKGYFDIIHDVDLFIFYDDVQYTKRDWRNRNKIKTPNGPMWLVIPVGADDDKLINEITLKDHSWQAKHWRNIEQFYSRATHFKRYRDFFRQFYLDKKWTSLSEMNQYLTKNIAAEFLGIKSVFADSCQFHACGNRHDRLIDVMKKTDADVYVSGPTARGYIDETDFSRAGIQLIYKDYSGYPEHTQFFPPFVHEVSILDLLFHTGPDAPQYIWGWREKNRVV